MPYLTDKEIDLSFTTKLNCKYIIASQHRKIGNPHKCKWIIPYKDEINCFINAQISEWIIGPICWGVKVSGTNLQTIGRNINDEDLKFAKFVDSSNSNIWHGYPADYKNRSQDIPDISVLLSWKENHYLEKHHIRKIKQGMPCNL